MDAARRWTIVSVFAAALTASCAEVALMSMGMESSVAKYVASEEMTGVVIDVGTGKPVPGAIVAMAFRRHNTGHSGPHCFRSMAVKTDAAGRFRFTPWKQANTRANWAIGEVTAYKAGYANWGRPLQVLPYRESGYRETLEINKLDMWLQLAAFSGTDSERIEELGRLVGNFTCRWQAEFDDLILLFAIRDETTSSSFANQKLRYGYYTATTWIEDIINRTAPKRDDSSGGKR